MREGRGKQNSSIRRFVDSSIRRFVDPDDPDDSDDPDDPKLYTVAYFPHRATR